MSSASSIFPFWHIVLTAVAAFVFSFALLWILRRRGYTLSTRTILGLALLTGASVLFWRSAGNVAQLNDDPIPPFSPNDVICPMVTYVCLGLVESFFPAAASQDWRKTRTWLTLVSFLVNVLFI